MKRSIIKNRAPAPIQITAEQILREAQDRKENVSRAPRRNIADKDELIEYRMTQRKQFEDTLRRQRQHIGTWIKYANWEEQQHEFERARSIFERALDVDYRNSSIWLKYAEMEMRYQFINHARNVWDRAVTLLPRVAQFWYKYAFMEEMVGNLPAARRIFERWMEWQPEDQAWYSYIKFEMRAEEIPRARALYERYISSHKSERAYLKFANWEEKQQHQIVLARCIYERAMEELRPDERTQLFYTGFASFEERCQEFDRARAIYQYALDQLDREDAENLYHAFIQFEKKHGDKKRIEDVVVAKRRVHYEKQVTVNEFDYDAWIDYMKLEETQVIECHDNQREDKINRVREIYERAIANVPPMQEKKYWRRYVYLWIKYAIFEELIVRKVKYDNLSFETANDSDEDRVKQVYTTCLALIPHDVFTFAKIWIMYAKYLVRLRDVQGARKVLGQSLGKCPKKKLFTSYIELELMMGEIERCRTLYEKFLLFDASDCETWQKFATLEQQMGESERARGIYELAIQQPVLDMPEMIWKAYIDFEILNQEIEKARLLYERLLERTKHVKVWISFAQFEFSQSKMVSTDLNASPSTSLGAAREVFERAIRHLKEQQQLCLEEEANVSNSLSYEKKAERALCLETWLEMEQTVSTKDVTQIQKLIKMQPQKVTKQRMAYAEDGTELGLEDYTDYVFADDEKAQNHMKLLLAAQKWKKTKLAESDDQQDT
ncbi:hypothetical protein ABG067_002984 [Albugo candida]